MSLFEEQQTPELILESKIFYRLENEWIKDNNINRVRKSYLQNKYFQFLTENYQDNINITYTYNHKYFCEKTNKNIETIMKIDTKWLFSKAIDILIRHLLTQGHIIQENSETKADYYSASIERVFRLGVKSYDREKGTAFNHFTTVINNEIKQQFKNAIIRKNIAKNKLKKDGIDGHVGNLDFRYKNDLEAEYEIEHNTKLQGEYLSMFIKELKKNYNPKKLRIIEDENAPKFKIKYKEFDYFIECTEDGKGVVVEYVDLLKFNEDRGTSKNYFNNRMKFLRDRGYQYFLAYSDVYNDKDIDDNVYWNKLDKMIEFTKTNSKSMEQPINMSHRIYNPSLQYIPKETFKIMRMEEPIWSLVDEKRLTRIASLEQNIEAYQQLRQTNSKYTRIYDVGMCKI